MTPALILAIGVLLSLAWSIGFLWLANRALAANVRRQQETKQEAEVATAQLDAARARLRAAHRQMSLHEVTSILAELQAMGAQR